MFADGVGRRGVQKRLAEGVAEEGGRSKREEEGVGKVGGRGRPNT